ncbi:MAG TPA: vitamin B12-dependent ribonucleotide reductase [Candidatus Aerophobetes bacterium]|uniref:Vitamin B12-dependent ribonucleotide reductase n=1 Tax=Aerophobetes bacterium TaxID=2030807 RepID=A0A7V5I0I7_UNCAE|nr:vitamin B12-dependent ribonucleotide reductase [Candidatus Aerophobetes bacterium]
MSRKSEKSNLSENALTVLKKRYLRKDKEGNIVETPEQMFKRVASNIASADGKYGEDKDGVKRTEEKFYRLMASLEFLPNSPTLMNAGTPLQQLSACFVLPVDDSIESIYEAIKYSALIHKSGGGTGFSFSRIRPKGSPVGTTSGVASGPVSFMKVFDASTEAIKQGGRRRGANMGILDVSHPDIMEFITCKEKEGEVRNFNISVAVTDNFMEAAQKGEDYELVDPRTGEVTGRLNAAEVLDKIAEMAWKNGEPGLIFIDRINQFNPTPHIGKIEATNPCGEQPLLPYESCNLGSINLSKMVKEGKVDWEKLKSVVHTAVHFLDNVIDANKYPLPQIEKNTKENRKIGLGVMGFADMLVKLNIPYNSKKALNLAEKVMNFIQEESKKASAELAKKRGTFPNFKGSIWDKKGIKVRNATTTTIAPTGSISMIADCSSGIEPIFSLVYYKHVLEGEKLLYINSEFEKVAREKGFYSRKLMEKIAENKGSCQNIAEIPEEIKKVFVTALDISYQDHVKMQAVFQKYTDNAVSKTINMPDHTTKSEVKDAFLLAWKLGCKGITIYRDKSRKEQVLNAGKKEEKALAPRPRPKVTYGMTREIRTGCGDLYVTITEDEKGEPFEVFAQLGKSGGCAASQTEAIGRLASLALRSGIPWSLVVKQLKGISCDRPWGLGKNKILSCADAVGKAIEMYIEEKIRTDFFPEGKKTPSRRIISEEKPEKSLKKRKIGACPECGSSTIEYEGGCFVCKSCGYSECE